MLLEFIPNLGDIYSDNLRLFTENYVTLQSISNGGGYFLMSLFWMRKAS